MPDDTQAQSDAAALVLMSVAELAAHLDGIDLPTLEAALAAEKAKGDTARKGAIAALEAAISGHPENAEKAAKDAEGSTDPVGPAATLADLARTLIPMRHPDGGACDLYEQNADGDIMVPADEAGTMIEHGFAVVAA